jgi:hypothetical protein
VADHADPTHSQGHTLRDRFTAAVAALFVATLVLGATPRTAHAAGLKVAIIVGPTGALTDQYRGYADEEAAAAAAAGATVVKVYSPKATWAKVKAAVAGANLVIYHGHGSGFPNPYGSTEMTDRANGWGLNKTETGGDAETGMVYCGEKALLGTLKSTDGAAQWSYCGGSTDSDGIAPAPNFVMVYANACYTAGSSEPGKPVGDLATARARVANFSYPVLKLGANGYFATDLGAESLVQRLLTQRDTSFADLYRADAGYDASAQRRSVHPDVDGDQVWVQKTYSRWLGTDYWYAFAGNPNATPNNGNIAPPPPPPSASVSRISGTDRYATAAAVSASQFDPGVGVAYVATGTNFPDALAGGAAAAHAHGPMLLVTQDTVPSATATELQRLQPKEIVVLGGNGTVSDGVLGALRSYTNGTVRRVALRDRRVDFAGRLRVPRAGRLRRDRRHLPRCAGRRPGQRSRRRAGAARLTDRHSGSHRDRARPAQAGEDRDSRRLRRRLERDGQRTGRLRAGQPAGGQRPLRDRSRHHEGVVTERIGRLRRNGDELPGRARRRSGGGHQRRSAAARTRDQPAVSGCRRAAAPLAAAGRGPGGHRRRVEWRRRSDRQPARRLTFVPWAAPRTVGKVRHGAVRCIRAASAEPASGDPST